VSLHIANQKELYSMSNEIVVDASGLSCPQPVLLTRNALKQHPERIIVVLVDSAASRDNCQRVAEKAGRQVVSSERPEGGYRLDLKP